MPKQAFPESIRTEVEKRAHGCCEYCLTQQRYSSYRFSIDHIVPPASGGSSLLDNLARCCQGCNNIKYTKFVVIDPETGKPTQLFNPRKDEWQKHFR